ncbi:MAG: hypothetical protein ACOX1Y_00130 [Zhaonellaceae bacterium]
MKVKINDEIINRPLHLKIRLDYKGEPQNRFFFGGKTGEKVAEEIREQKVALMRNVPFQGITINDIDMSVETYSIFDEVSGEEIAYAPVIVELMADDIEDIIRFIVKEEFRKIEIIEPQEIIMAKQDLERLIFKVNEEMRVFRASLEKKYHK